MLAITGLTPSALAPFLARVERGIRDAEGIAALAAAAAAGGAAPGARGGPAAAAAGAAAARAAPSSPAPLALALTNGLSATVVSGRSAHLAALAAALVAARAPAGDDQSRVPFSSRKPSLRLAFLRVSAPFHSPLLAEAVAAAVADAEAAGLGDVLARGALAVPVFATDDGRDLRGAAGGVAGGALAAAAAAAAPRQPSLLAELLALAIERHVNWPAVARSVLAATARGVAEGAVAVVVDLGPGGGTAGAARLLARLVAGGGVPVFVAEPGATPAWPRVADAPASAAEEGDGAESGSNEGSSGESGESGESGDAGAAAAAATRAPPGNAEAAAPPPSPPEDADAAAEASAAAVFAEGAPLFDARALIAALSGARDGAALLSAVLRATPHWAAEHAPRLLRDGAGASPRLETA
jgi:hypothetical protein